MHVLLIRSAGKKIKGDYREDEDVGLERQRVVTGEAKDDLLLLHNLRKVWSSSQRT